MNTPTNGSHFHQEAASTIPASTAQHPAWLRLENQLKWYGFNSRKCQKRYKQLKFAQVGLAALIPIMGLFEGEPIKWLMSLSGAVIAVLEAIQHMNQYSTNWIAYRSTAERLKHEKFLFLSEAGPYRNMPDKERLILLAERVEEQVSTEHALWVNEAKQAVAKDKKGKTT